MLAILRGEERIAPADGQQELFLTLRALACANSLSIQPAGAPYVSEGELTLLAWIAAAQRMDGLATTKLNPDMAGVIRLCAEQLSAHHLQLSPLTLYCGSSNMSQPRQA